MTPNERLLHLAAVLESVPEHRFTLTTWAVEPDEDYDPETGEVLPVPLSLPAGERCDRIAAELAADEVHLGHCGFAGCAVGWATQDPVLKAEGLRLSGMRSPLFDHYDHWHAVREFFDLSTPQADDLFNVSGYNEPHTPQLDPHPSVVAAKIREFVAGRAEGEQA